MATKETKRRKPAAQRREITLKVLITAAEERKLTKAAQAQGLAVSSYVRQAALKQADAETK